MEPARQGRDDEEFGSGVTPSAEPQWSPPVRGGTTARIARLSQGSAVPQWSPPVRGGTTPVIVLEHPGQQLAAMEPARQGRDDCPG